MLVCVEVYQLHLSCFQRYQEAQEKCRCIFFTIRTPDIPPTEPTVYQFGHPTPPCLENHRAPHCPAWRLRGSFCGVCFSDKRLTVRIYEYVLLVNTSMPGFTSKVDPPPLSKYATICVCAYDSSLGHGGAAVASDAATITSAISGRVSINTM